MPAPPSPAPGTPVSGSTGRTGRIGRSSALRSTMSDPRVSFLGVGAFNTAFGFAAFVAFDRVFAGLAPAWTVVAHNTATLACAHVVSVLVAFVLHRRLVFRVRGHVWRDLARFESVNLVMLGLNWVLLNLLSLAAGFPSVLAQACVLVVIAATSFFGHKHISFRRSDRDTAGGGRSDRGAGR
jgi:putative flippase GtrA